MTGSRLLFCTSRRSGGPLSRIPFEPGGFPVSGRAAAKDDAVRIPIYPCIRVSGIIRYPSCRAVSADIIVGVRQPLQLLPGFAGFILFVGSRFRHVPERFQMPVVTLRGLQGIGDISVTMADRATGIVTEAAEILCRLSHPVPVTDIQPEILRLSRVGICRKGDFLRIDRREISKYTFRLIDAYRSQVE